MLEAIERAGGYVAPGQAAFFSDYNTRSPIVHHLAHRSGSADQASARIERANPVVSEHLRPETDRTARTNFACSENRVGSRSVRKAAAAGQERRPEVVRCGTGVRFYGGRVGSSFSF